MGKVLFIRGGAVGDFILTLPAIKLMRDCLPENEIEILGYPSITELATTTGLADRTRSIEDARLATFFAPGAKLDEEWCDYFSSFDVVVSYLYDPDGYFSGNLEKAGVKTLLRGIFRPEESEPFVSASRQLARPLETLALFLEDPAPALDYEKTENTFPGNPVIALHPGSGSPSKNWSFESWANVIKGISEKHHEAHFLITAGEAELERIEQFHALIDPLGISWESVSGKSLTDLASLYRSIDFYLGHDSGISHLAASAGSKGLLLFGPTNPSIWAPETNRMEIIASPSKSLGDISVAQVLDRIELSTS
ncbi:MAG: hypothetical protein CMO55_03860 [Verrucomicrobiales bacterium]|nr:hypothetical protein [Verrucomicrobiales bacterium]